MFRFFIGDKKMSDETIKRWRFDKLRESATVALQLATELLRQREQGNWLDKDEEYHHTMALVAALAKGLHDGTAC
jgi:hypothetical protein